MSKKDKRAKQVRQRKEAEYRQREARRQQPDYSAPKQKPFRRDDEIQAALRLVEGTPPVSDPVLWENIQALREMTPASAAVVAETIYKDKPITVDDLSV